MYGSLGKEVKAMLKKTTIYLEEAELEKLKALSFVLNTSMTDLIRKGVQGLYETIPLEQRNALKNIASTKSGFSEGKTKKTRSIKSGKRSK